MNYACPLCERFAMDLTHAANEHAASFARVVATRDALVVAPRRHVRSLSLLSDAEYRSIWQLADAARQQLGHAWAISGTISPSQNTSDELLTDHAHVLVVPHNPEKTRM